MAPLVSKASVAFVRLARKTTKKPTQEQKRNAKTKFDFFTKDPGFYLLTSYSSGTSWVADTASFKTPLRHYITKPFVSADKTEVQMLKLEISSLQKTLFYKNKKDMNEIAHNTEHPRAKNSPFT